MELPKQVCTLEQAMKLKELGIYQKSLFYWSDESAPQLPPKYEITYRQYCRNKGGVVTPYYSAFTVAELGAMLGDFKVEKCGNVFYQRSIETWSCFSPSLGYVMSAMLIYLLENNLVTATDCNARLS